MAPISSSHNYFNLYLITYQNIKKELKMSFCSGETALQRYMGFYGFFFNFFHRHFFHRHKVTMATIVAMFLSIIFPLPLFGATFICIS